MSCSVCQKDLEDCERGGCEVAARPMKVVYVVGPYRAATQEEVSRSVERAREAGQELLRAGLCAVVPT